MEIPALLVSNFDKIYEKVAEFFKIKITSANIYKTGQYFQQLFIDHHYFPFEGCLTSLFALFCRFLFHRYQ